MRLLPLLLILFASCGQPTTTKQVSIPRDFLPYTSLYEHYTGKPIDDLIIRYGVFNKPTILATCTTRPGSTPTIMVSATHWPTLSDLNQEELILHELGHCIDHLDHTDTEIDIMNTYHLGESYEPNRDYLLSKYFNQLITLD